MLLRISADTILMEQNCRKIGVFQGLAEIATWYNLVQLCISFLRKWGQNRRASILPIGLNNANIFISERTGETCEAFGPEGS